MKHRASVRFWRLYRALPQEIQQLADRGYQMLLQDPRHPSLHFKRIGRVWSARVGLPSSRYARLEQAHTGDLQKRRYTNRARADA